MPVMILISPKWKREASYPDRQEASFFPQRSFKTNCHICACRFPDCFHQSQHRLMLMSHKTMPNNCNAYIFHGFSAPSFSKSVIR